MIVGSVAVTALMIYPLGRKNAQEQFKRIGLINRAGEVPCLIRKFRDKDNRSLTVWEFTTYGIPIQEWEKNQYYIEAALDINIVKIRYRRGKSRIQLYTVPARAELPAQIQWKDKYLSKDSFVLALGESHLGQVTVDLTKIPHILLGGSTGSGKSVLLKLILMQAIQKRARVYIADFKGGVDFTNGWQDKCDLCFDEERLIEVLEMLTAVLEQRKAIFRDAGCANLDEYNKTLKDAKLPRFILACDEAAEILDKTGLTKEQKERVAKIESKLSMIARQGRAFGIHLILATQRPDATIIPGQIRNNIDCRICGRADNVLSQIILDNTAAAEQIPKDARGRFLLHDGTIFQAYWFDENTI